MKKNYFFLGLFIICVLGLALIIWGPRESNDPHPEKIRSTQDSPPLPEKSSLRKPASIKERKYLGQKPRPAKLEVLNKNGPWEKELRDQLTRYLPPQSEIEIKHEHSVLIPVADTTSAMAESVVVVIKNKETGETSYRALIDSETGRILQTWDRTIHENPDQQRTPKGVHENEVVGFKQEKI